MAGRLSSVESRRRRRQRRARAAGLKPVLAGQVIGLGACRCTQLYSRSCASVMSIVRRSPEAGADVGAGAAAAVGLEAPEPIGKADCPS